MSNEELRASIEKSIQARDSRAIVDVYEPRTLRDEWRVVTYLDGVDVDSRAATLAGTLASFAAACGLNADGSDPRAELEAERKRAAAEEWQRRALCNEGNRLGEQLGWANSRAVHAELEVERLKRELAEARALLHGGRTPTDAQIAAHEGKWLIVKDHSSGYAASAVGEERALETARYEREHPGSGYVWHAIDEASGAIVPPPKE